MPEPHAWRPFPHGARTSRYLLKESRIFSKEGFKAAGDRIDLGVAHGRRKTGRRTTWQKDAVTRERSRHLFHDLRFGRVPMGLPELARRLRLWMDSEE